MVVRNPNPDTRGLRAAGTTPVFYVEQQFDHWTHCKIRGQDFTPLPIPEHPVFISKREVLRRTGLSYVTILNMEKQGRFPPRVRPTLVSPGVEESADAAD
jgi:hypothetical protein